MVLSVDKENQKFSLGMKQMEEDPWKKIEERYPVGAVVEAEVVRLTDFGGFVELETGIEGLIHISEISEARVEKVSDVLKKGEVIKAMVISIDRDAKKIALSKKAVGSAEDMENIKSNKVQVVKAATLGDKFKGIKIEK